METIFEASADEADVGSDMDPDDTSAAEFPESREISDARDWFDDEEVGSGKTMDINEILKSCLKRLRKLKTPRAFLALTQLTLVQQYVNLRLRYIRNPRCKRPSINASLAAARLIGKGPYIARQIRKNEQYLLHHHQLPPSKKEGHHAHFTLLDNENVLQGVRKYLAAQALGKITPLELAQHVNTTICPALGLSGNSAKISERSAINWLHKLGYACVETKKGLYHDGHERPDVIEARKIFLAQMEIYER